jgi:DNA-binding NarL/FixJ family response regulator
VQSEAHRVTEGLFYSSALTRQTGRVIAVGRAVLALLFLLTTSMTPGVQLRALDLSLKPETQAPLAKLNPRERRIAALVARGMRNRAIGAEIGIGEGTVKVYLHAMHQKLGIDNRTELALLALGERDS